MSKNYGWTGEVRHGLWRCVCKHWNYYRTGTIRIDSRCRAQGCNYRARVVLDRSRQRGGRPRQVVVHEYPSYRPPRSIKSEQRERNRFSRRNREMHERMRTPELGDRGVFHTASEIQAAQDAADLKRHGGTFRLEDGKGRTARHGRHPELGDSRMKLTMDPDLAKKRRANNDENDPQDPA